MLDYVDSALTVSAPLDKLVSETDGSAPKSQLHTVMQTKLCKTNHVIIER